MILPSFRTNQLAMWSVGANAIYWALGLMIWTLPGGGAWWSAFVSAWLIVSGSLLATVAIPQSLHVVKKGEIGPAEIAALGIALLSGGLLWSGLFSVAYYIAGRPDSWIGPFSGYGRACAGVGMTMLFLAPEATRVGLRAPRPIVILIAIILTALIAFGLGLTFADNTVLNSSAVPFESTSTKAMVDLLLVRRA